MTKREKEEKKEINRYCLVVNEYVGIYLKTATPCNQALIQDRCSIMY